MIKKIKDTRIAVKVIALIVISALFTLILSLLLFLVITNAVEWFGGNKAENYIRSFTVFTMLLLTIGLSSIIGLGIHVSRSVRLSLKQIVRAIKVVGDGGVDVELKKTANDEFGEIIDALLETVENIREDAKLAYQIAEGDLSMKVNPRTDIDLLGKAFNKLVTDQNHILGNIREASMQVTTGSEQVASASQSIAQGSTEQASSLEEITASISEIADRTKVNASQANNAI